MIKVLYMSNWCNPLYWKVINIKKWLKPILLFVFCNDWLQNHCWLSIKSMTPNVLVVVRLYFPFVAILAGICHICAFCHVIRSNHWWKGVNTRLWSELEHKEWHGKCCSKNIKAIVFACELWVKRIGTFGVVLRRNQWPIFFFSFSWWIAFW